MSNLVSVIMPVYNGVLFVGEAIGSVLTQTLTDWELIVVDDGSTDATPQVLSEFTDPRIRVIRQKNGGEGAARNTGLDAATGQYVAFLDADDLHLPNGLADMISYLESHRQFDVVYSDGVMCDQDRKPLMCLSEIRPGMYEGNILEHLVLSNIITAPDCTTVRRSAIEALGLRFDPLLKYGVDWDFWTQLARFSQFGYMPVLTCTYRVHGSNMTSAAGLRKRKNDLVVGRLKVMNADWFSALSVGTRRDFFYNLLIGLLDDNPEQQKAIMQAPPFQALPVDIQADLQRLTAGTHLRQRQNTAFALQCLQRSLELQPESGKGRLLLRLAGQSPALTAAALSAWRVAHNAQTHVRSLGRRKPKPVPAALMPTSE